MLEDFRRRFWVSALLTLPILILSPMIQKFFGVSDILFFKGQDYVLFALSSVVYLYGGRPFIVGLKNELANKNPGMMTLICIAITVAYLYSGATVFGLSGKPFFWELATLIDIMLLGHWIEMKSVMGAGAALEELSKLMPDTARLQLKDGTTKEVPLKSLKKGDKLVVKPGEKIPADGTVVEGESDVNEAMLTGESTPVTKKEGNAVIGGAINGEGLLVIEVAKIGDESFLSSVIKLVEEAQSSKSKTQDLANRAAFWLTIIALVGGALTFSIWLWIPMTTLAYAMERMVTVMVITCPHALGLAVPLVVAMSTSLGAQHGLLIRNRAAFERARNVGAIVFDKTGTLTKGEFGVEKIIPLTKDITQEDLLNYAAAVDKNSEHPIAQGIVKEAKEIWNVKDFKSMTGKGVQGTVKGANIKVVSPSYLRDNKISLEEVGNEHNHTIVYVLKDDQPIGALLLADIIRPESKKAIEELKKMNVQCIMLTGDNQQVANWVAQEIGIDEVIAEIRPDQKADKIKEIQKRGLIVAMTGDGINDAPALAQADVGIAVGAGTDVAIETADIILVKSNPMDIVAIIGLAKNTYTKMVQNLIWATGYNAVAIPAAAGVFYQFEIVLNPAVAAVFMTLSTIICAINAKLLKYQK
jgi:Cu2+-exporting ATPase